MTLVPLKIMPVGAVLGDNESAESLALPAVYSSRGSLNTWLDRYGRATAILGYTRLTPAPLLSTTGKPMIVRALYHYTRPTPGSPDPNAVLRTEIGVFDTGPGGPDYEIWTSTDGGTTWARQLNLGAAALDRVPDFGQQGQFLAICVGSTIPVYSYDGITLAPVSSSRLVPPLTVAVGTGVLNGRYTWRVQPVKSDGTLKAASASSIPLNLANQNATVSWTADPDGTVIGYNILRTTAGGATFFVESFVAGRTTVTYTSTMSDTALIQNAVADFQGDSPPAGMMFAEAHKERMWYGDQQRRWYYSDPGRPQSLQLDTGFLDMTDANSMSDHNRGGTGNFRGMFVAWLERSIWTVSGTGVTAGAIIDFQRRRSSAQMGTVSHRTVARVPKGAVYIDATSQSITVTAVSLAYLTPLGDVRIFDGENDTIISFLKQDTFTRLTYQSRAKAFAVTDTVRNEVTWVFPADGSTEPSLAVTWNYQYGTMNERSWPFGHAIEAEAAQDSSLLLAGAANLTLGALVYELWRGSSFDGLPITAHVTTKTLYGQSGGALSSTNEITGADPNPIYSTKRFRWVEALIKVDGPVQILVEWWPTEQEMGVTVPYGSSLLDATIHPLYSADGDPVVSADGDTIQVGQLQIMWRALIREGAPGGYNRGRYMHSRGVRFRWSTVPTTAQWSIVGFTLAYQVLDGLKRDFRR